MRKRREQLIERAALLVLEKLEQMTEAAFQHSSQQTSGIDKSVCIQRQFEFARISRELSEAQEAFNTIRKVSARVVVQRVNRTLRKRGAGYKIRKSSSWYYTHRSLGSFYVEFSDGTVQTQFPLEYSARQQGLLHPFELMAA